MRPKPLIYCRRSITAWQQDAKGQTRRLAKPLPDKEDWKPYQDPQGRWWWLEQRPRAGFRLIPMRQPYAVGQLLWIREGLLCWRDEGTDIAYVTYQADSRFVYSGEFVAKWAWKRARLPAMFMPKFACRYYARVVSVQPERLQDISDADVSAEGTLVGIRFPTTWYQGKSQHLYETWWSGLHNKPRTRWKDNPWVWVYGLVPVDSL